MTATPPLTWTTSWSSALCSPGCPRVSRLLTPGWWQRRASRKVRTPEAPGAGAAFRGKGPGRAPGLSATALPEDVDGAGHDQGEGHDRDGGLGGHAHLRPPGQRHRVGRAERGGVGERQVQVVGEGRLPVRRGPPGGGPPHRKGRRGNSG